MRVGLVGFAQSGKTTLFNALTGLNAQTGGGRRSGAPNLGVIRVPDQRVDRLAAIYRPRKTTHAEVVFVDVPGPAGTGRGLDSATLQALREVDALAVVLRGFPRLDGSPADPCIELVDFETELVLNDLQIVERRLERVRREPSAARERGLLTRLQQRLDAGHPLRGLHLEPAEQAALSSFTFLSQRPLLAVLNAAESAFSAGPPAALIKVCDQRGVQLVDVSAPLEAEIRSLDSSDQGEFLAGLGIAEPASIRLIQAAYQHLDCASFFTVGEDEVRAWTIRRGDRARRAAGRIHSDLERGFIRAEVMAYADFVELGSEQRMKRAGKFRVEGKDYRVRDGDILNIRFNV